MTNTKPLIAGLVALLVAVLCVLLVETTKPTGETDPLGRLDCLTNAARVGDNPDMVCAA